MTQVLDAIRRLDEALERGDISEARYAAMRREITELVEEAQMAEEVAEGPAPEQPRSEAAELVKTAALILFGLVMLTGLVAWATGDVMLALTLSVVVLAGIVIHHARGLIAEDRAEAEARKPAGPALDEYDENGRSVPAE